MERKTKRVFKIYRYTQCDAFAEYLNRMAAEGWHLKNLGLGMIFEKGEPSGEIYDVQVFLKNKENDSVPSPDTMEYAQFCEAAGWEMVDSNRQFVIFRRTREDAIPIVTPEEKLEDVSLAERRRGRNILPLLFLWTITFGFQLVSQPSYALFHPALIGMCFFLLAAYLTLAGSAVHLAFWKERKLQEIRETGRFSCTESLPDRLLKGAGNLICLVPVLYIVWDYRTHPLFWCIFFLTFGLSVFVAAMRPTRQERISVLVAVFLVMVILGGAALPAIIEQGDREREEKTAVAAQDLPLALSDLTGEESPAVFLDAERSRTMFGEKVTCEMMDDRSRGISYAWYHSDYDRVVQAVWKEQMKRWSPSDGASAGPWGAKEVRKNGYANAVYYVRYEDAVFFLSVDHELEEQEIRTVREKLGY